MIQTPILDRALQNPKDSAPASSSSQTQPKKSNGPVSNLKDRLESQKGSQNLSLVDMFLGDEGAYEVAKFLKMNKEFSSIQLRGNNISAAGFEAICQALRGFMRLREIAAEWNNLGSDISGLVALHQFLRSNTSVEVIDLQNNRLGPNCGRVIGDIIRDSNSLKRLDLRWNELGEEGGRAILQAFQSSNKNVSVDLNGNKIPEEILTQIDSIAQKSSLNKAPLGEKYDMNRGLASQQTASKQLAFSTADRGLNNRVGNYSPPSKEDKIFTNNNDRPASYTIEQRSQITRSALSSKYDKDQINNNNKASASTYVRPSDTKQEFVPKTDIGQRQGLYSSNIRTSTFQDNERTFQKTSEVGYPQILSDKKTFESSSTNYSPPRRNFDEKYDPTVVDVLKHIETSKQNLSRYSPPRSQYEVIREEAVSRPNYEIRHEIHRKSEPKVTSQPPLERPSITKYRQVTQATPIISDVNADINAALRRSVHLSTQPVEVREIREVHVHHEAEEGNLKVGKLISDLERMVERERMRANEAEGRLHALSKDFEVETMMRQELERKHTHIIEELRRRDIEVNELRIHLDTFASENTGLKEDVAKLHRENLRLDDFNKVRLSEIEQKYQQQLKQADAENHALKDQLHSIEHDLNDQIISLRRELETRSRQYEDQIMEFSKLNDELSTELASQLDFIEKLKIEHEEHIKRTVAQAREEEIHKAQIVIRGLEEELRNLRIANEQLTAKNAEMLQDLQTYEKQIREQHIQFANELGRLGAEIDRLRTELANANGAIQRQNSELSARDGIIIKLEGEIERLRVELQRLAEANMAHLENLKREFENERRRFAENERQLILKIEELERRLVESQNETIIITKEYDRLVEIMQGNVTKAIYDTFAVHKNTSEIRHIEHRTTTPGRAFFK